MVKRGVKNIIWGVLGQLITIALGIVVPRLVLTSFGSEINGLLNSITQIFAYFTLIEAGIGVTTTQALYKPTAEQDRDGVNGILSATSRYYKRVAVFYLIAVIAFAVIYPFTVKSSLPKSWIFLIIILNGLGSVINFWVQGKYTIFLGSIGKSYINTNLGTVCNVLTSASKIILLMNGCDVLQLQVVYFVISILKMLFIYWYIKKNYPWINVKAKPNYNALNQKNSVFIHQISFLIFSNTDILLITYFLGLKEVSVYSMYLMFFTYVNVFATQIYNGFTFRLGQIYQKSIELYKKYHDIFEVFYLSVVFIMFTMTFLFIVPFLGLYTSGVNDINYLDWKLALLFFIMQLLSCGRNSSIMVINYAGHFKNTLKQTIIESAINLIASIVFLQLFGVYGVLMGTIAALLYRMIDMVVYANKKLLNRSSFITFRRWLIDVAVAAIIIFVFSRIPFEFNSYLQIILIAVITGVVITAIYLLTAMITERKAFKDAVELIKSILQRRKNRNTSNTET